MRDRTDGDRAPRSREEGSRSDLELPATKTYARKVGGGYLTDRTSVRYPCLAQLSLRRHAS